MFERKQCEMPELRECKRCLRVVPIKEIYHFYKNIKLGDFIDLVFINGVICKDCASLPVENARRELELKADEMMQAENAKYTPKQVEVKDLPKGKVK